MPSSRLGQGSAGSLGRIKCTACINLEKHL